jgi:hypothetical protein
MTRYNTFLLGLLLASTQTSQLTLGFIPSSSTDKQLSSSHSRTYLLPNDRTPSSPPPPKQRVITPNDIASLFGSSKLTAETRPAAVDDEDDDIYEDEEEEEDNFGRDIMGSGSGSTLQSKPSEPNQLGSISMSSYSKDSVDLPAPSIRKPVVAVEPPAPGLDYLDLTRELEGSDSSSLKEAMSLLESGEGGQRLTAPRVFLYDPTESNSMYDPMQFGAYNRWKKAEEAVAKANLKKNPKKKNKEGLSTDSFYNAIKNLGSGPKGKSVRPS